MSNYLEKYIDGSWDMNMYLSGLEKEVDWTQPKTWTPSEIKQAVKHFNKIAQTIEKETIVYRGTTMPSPLMLPLAPELPGPGNEKLGQVVSTTYSKSIAEEFFASVKCQTSKRSKKVGYLHILKLQPGVKIIDMKKQFEDCDKDKACVREEEVLLVPGYKMIMQSVIPIEYGEDRVCKWQFTWLVY